MRIKRLYEYKEIIENNIFDVQLQIGATQESRHLLNTRLYIDTDYHNIRQIVT